MHLYTFIAVSCVTLVQVFHYTARLRMPALATKLEREQKVMDQDCACLLVSNELQLGFY
jgi:hypothetical protein